jgi:hypothetical protein
MRLDRLIQRCHLGIAGLVGLSWLRFARCRAALGHQLTLRLAIYAGNTSLELGQTDQRLPRAPVLRSPCQGNVRTTLTIPRADNMRESLVHGRGSPVHGGMMSTARRGLSQGVKLHCTTSFVGSPVARALSKRMLPFFSSTDRHPGSKNSPEYWVAALAYAASASVSEGIGDQVLNCIVRPRRFAIFCSQLFNAL